MSRKNKHLDTGGLDLTRFEISSPSFIEVDLEPCALCADGYPILKVGDAEVHEALGVIWSHPLADGIPKSVLPGLTMFQALSLSPYVRMAARKISDHLDLVLVANGRRFWVADINTLQPIPLDQFIPPMTEQPVWRPINGTEKGLVIS